MSERLDADDPAVLAIASAIAHGTPVDWQRAGSGADKPTTAALQELEVLERVSRLNDPTPSTWGPFSINDEIGRGSYGTVYRAFDTTLDIEIALKVIRKQPPRPFDPTRALREARLLAKVSHPNVVRIFRAEHVGHEVGVAMELLQGRTLADLIRRQGPCSAREVMLIGADLCCGLAAVHAAGLVHGDIKAQNVMRVAGGRTVLMDFGSGRDVKADAETGRGVAGTPLYLAPEVFGGAVRTPVFDIYSVGVLLFHLATGRFPVEGHSREEVQRKHEWRTPRLRLRDLRPELPDAFIDVVERATAEHAIDRYQTVGELEAALNRALRSDTPVSPLPAPPAPWWRTRTALLGGGAAAVVAMAAIIGLGRDGGSRGTPIDDRPVASAAVAAPAAPSTPAAADDAYRIEAAFYRRQADREVRLEPGARVAPGDQLSLQVRSSVPTYVYVVNEDDRGSAYLLYPLPGVGPGNPLPPGEPQNLPGKAAGENVYWRVDTAGGREHFLIFASPQPPSPAFQRVFNALARPSAGAPVVLAQPLDTGLESALRGVGGLVKAPGLSAEPGLRSEFGAPLLAVAETVRGVWMRQMTLENPGR